VSGYSSSPTWPSRRTLPSHEEAEVLRLAARAAEDAGDFRGALRLVRRLPDSGDTRRWVRQLEEVLGLPEDAPQRATWLVHPAVRWARERAAGEVLERYARLLLVTLGVLGAEREQLLGLVASTDPVVVDAGLFDAGLLQRYVSESLSPALISRGGPLAQWPAHSPSVFRFEEVRDDCVVLHDLWSGEQATSLTWPAARLTPIRTLMFGRLVPVVGAVGRAFALPPIRVDQRCAVRLGRARQRGEGPEERLRAIARFRRRDQQGRAAA
jgi:hypothetical protein